MLTLTLQSRVARVAMLALALFGWGSLVSLSLLRFVTAVVADPEVQVEQATLEAAAAYFPNSARVQARLAARLLEAGVDDTQNHEGATERALAQAAHAARLAPWNYEAQVLLSAAKELNGDLSGAEVALRAARQLAPSQANLRWRLANLLLRAEKFDEALNEFRAAAVAVPERLPATLNLVWQAAGGQVEALRAVTGSEPTAQLALAQFLAGQAQAKPAAQIFRRLDRSTRLGLPESGRFIDVLISSGEIELAGQLWRETLGNDGPTSGPLIWNGGFETPVRKGFAQFDWNLSQSKWARIGLTTAAAHAGQRSLRVLFLGVETTRLEAEIKQLVLVRPGAHYRLECYVKTQNLNTPGEGPQLAVLTPDSKTPIAASTTLATGTHDWQPLAVDFVAPVEIQALLITIKQTPRFSYVEPTQGTVWLDDFSLKEN